MDTSSRSYKRAKFLRQFAFWGLFLLFIVLFRGEIATSLKGLFLLIKAISSHGFNMLNLPFRERVYIELGLDENIWRSMRIIVLNVVVYFSVAGLAMFNVAQFILPVRTRQERWKAFNRFFRYLFGKHGPAIFVKEGKKIATQKEVDNVRPGVALVDLSSAIVLEQQQNTWAWQIQRWQDEQLALEKETGSQLLKSFRKALRKLRGETPPWVRVFGPGVVFTKDGEKIHSVLDLRRQVRSQGDVQAFTRDGIEIKNPVFVVFSLSDAPEIIPVAYIGGPEQSNLYGLKLQESKENNTTQIEGYFELDGEDAAEIHQFVQFGTVQRERLSIESSTQQSSIFKPPYPFHEQRVFAAAFAQAHTADDLTPWDELPLRVAIDIFRKEMEKYNFDDLQKIDNLAVFPLPDIKEKFSLQVRYQGILSYKLVKKAKISEGLSEEDNAWNEQPFDFSDIGEKGTIWSSPELIISSPRELMTRKVLRDRGIRVIVAGFPELRVADDALRQNLIESWKARWEREIDKTRAQHKLEAKREVDLARAQTQREMTYVISNLFRTTAHSKEALALRIFQALERGTANGLPSREVLSMLQSLYRWLLTQRKEFERKSRSKPKGQHWVGGDTDTPEVPRG